MSQLVFIPKEYNFANYITNAFGQFDNYTPMQLAQYVGTIANNGVRIAPHIVEGIYGNNEQGGLGNLIQSIDTKEMNKINISESDVPSSNKAFIKCHMVVVLWQPVVPFQMAQRYPLVEKQVLPKSYVAGGQKANNTNAVAYAPSDNPQIAVAVVFPHNTNLTNGVGPSMRAILSTSITNIIQWIRRNLCFIQHLLLS